jgi:hypothetical protein
MFAAIMALQAVSASAAIRPGLGFTSEGGNFRVDFPNRPEEAASKREAADGASIEIHTFTVLDGQAIYMVSYNDLPETVLSNLRHGLVTTDQVLDSARDQGLNAAQGRLLDERRIAMGGNPGRDLEFMTHNDLRVNVRHYLINGRLYQVLVLSQYPSGDRDTRDFLDSFRVLGV